MNPDVGFVTQLNLPFEESLAAAGDAGFDYVEVMMDGDEHRTALADRTDELRATLDGHGLDAAVHLPFPIDLGSPHDRQREGGVAELRACLDVAGELDAHTAVVHPTATAWGTAWDDDQLRPRVQESLRELVAHAEDRGVELCAENIFGSVHTVAEMPELLAATPVSMTLDTGHARVSGYDAADTAAFVAEHADRIGHVHLNDTRGPSDEHLPFGAGDLDFGTVLGAFPDGWDGSLSLEVATGDLSFVTDGKARLAAVLDRAG